MTRLRVNLLAGLLLALFATQVLTSMVSKSATFDEQVYAAAGYVYLELNDFRLKRDAPPLLSILAGLALHAGELAGLRLALPIPGDTWERCERWNLGAEWKFGRQVFAHPDSDGFAALQVARLPILLFGLLLGVYLFVWGRRLFGDAGALVALGLYCLDPNMIAHSRVVSADVPTAALMVISHYYFYRLVTERGLRALGPFALAFAACLLIKYTGMLMLPSMGLVGLLLLARPDLAGPGGGSPGAARLWLVKRGSLALGVGAAAFALLAIPLYQRWDAPLAYVQGLDYIYQTRDQDYLFYFMGAFHRESLPHYYLVATLLKTPAATLAVLLLALLPWGKGYNWRALLPLAAPILVVMLVSSQDQVNHCQRRVLTIFPFLFLLGGRLAWAWGGGALPGPSWRPRAPLKYGALGSLFVLAALSAWTIHPHQLSFFNALSGGPEAGHRYLDDANIDWGQDLPGLKAFMERHGVKEVGYLSTALEAPEQYGIRTRPVIWAELRQPRQAVYALGVHYMIRLKEKARKQKDPRLDWLERFEPSHRAGYSINIYDFRKGAPK